MSPDFKAPILFAVAMFAIAPARAQSRTVALLSPPQLGVQGVFRYDYPAMAVGNFGVHFLTAHTSGVAAIVVPGFTSSGSARVDLASVVRESWFALDASLQASWSIEIPNDSTFLGFAFDVQSVDVDFVANAIAWADNDVEVAVAAFSPPSALALVAIPAGTFAMGSDATTGAPYFSLAAERPVHAVTITRPFWIGTREVTQSAFQALMGSNPSSFVHPDRPVEQVTWVSAVAYCAALTANEVAAGRVPTGYVYRLPTEAEWEYCSRAGSSTEFSVGAGLVCAQANFGFSYHSGTSCWLGHTLPVGSFAPNAFGLHDVHGNVAEWCQDSWDGSANYPAAAVSDPLVGGGTVRIVRGGAWNDFSRDCRSAFRAGIGQHFSGINLGFRIVLAPALP
ncbi:MAG: formylglycine-generating enzyme family protein [Planctomycetota bacterium]